MSIHEEDTLYEIAMPENAEIIALGLEAEQFRSSNLGKYLLGCAERDATKAMSALATIDPDNKTEIMKLQSNIARLHDFNNWLDEVITGGNMAYQEYLENKSALDGM